MTAGPLGGDRRSKLPFGTVSVLQRQATQGICGCNGPRSSDDQTPPLLGGLRSAGCLAGRRCDVDTTNKMTAKLWRCDDDPVRALRLLHLGELRRNPSLTLAGQHGTDALARRHWQSPPRGALPQPVAYPCRAARHRRTAQRHRQEPQMQDGEPLPCPVRPCHPERLGSPCQGGP